MREYDKLVKASEKRIEGIYSGIILKILRVETGRKIRKVMYEVPKRYTTETERTRWKRRELRGVEEEVIEGVKEGGVEAVREIERTAERIYERAYKETMEKLRGK